MRALHVVLLSAALLTGRATVFAGPALAAEPDGDASALDADLDAGPPVATEGGLATEPQPAEPGLPAPVAPPPPLPPAAPRPPPAAAPAPAAAPITPSWSSPELVPAKGEPPSAFEADMGTARVGTDIYWFSTKMLGSTIDLVPFLQAPIGATTFFDFDLPFTVNVGSRDGTTLAALGNPTFGIHAISNKTPNTAWYVGARANAPLRTLDDNVNDGVASLLAAATTALYDLRYWVHDYLPIGAFVGVESLAGTDVILRAQLAPEVEVPLGNATSSGAQFVYQVRAEGEYRAATGWGGGLGVRFIHMPTASSSSSTSTRSGDGDDAQGSMDVFVSRRVPKGFIGRFGMLVALDPPLGFGGDTGKVLTFYLSLGSHL